MSIGANIRRFRKAKGLTQKQLAELINVSTITIQRYEAEKFKPKTEHLESIAKCLGITVDTVIDFDIYKYFDIPFEDIDLNKQAAILEILSEMYGKDVMNLVTDYCLLNDLGKRKVAEYARDILSNKKYRKE